MHRIDIIKLAASIAACHLAGFVGGLFTGPAIPSWYVTLRKPPFTPPSWVFGPVWLALYTLMGIALFLVWRGGLSGKEEKVAVTVFFVQLALNAFWSIAFFGFRSPLAGLVVIVLLWVAIMLTDLGFARISAPAAILLLPYMIWVGFAAVLNASIYIMNR